MAAKSKSGGNTISGTAGNDHLNGGAGADDLQGLGGNDRINGGSGADILDGGAGNDIVSGDSGDDLLIYDMGENAGSTDTYDGGSGRDTLQLEMTRAEWQSPEVQADIARYLAFLAEVTHPVNGQANNRNFTFSSGLTVSKFESLSVIVDGVAIDPRDEAVTLADDVMSAGEETASISVDVLVNDSVPDLIASLTNTQPTHGTVSLTQTQGAPGSPDTASFIYTPDATHWQHLAEGETATDTFTYTVTDSDGDVQTATVTVTITGSNDAPTLGAVVSEGAVVEDGASSASGSIAFADVDLLDSHSVTSQANGAGYLGVFSAGVADASTGDGEGSVSWSFSVDNAAIQYLAAGETLTQSYTVTIDDGNGGTIDQIVTVTLTGTNDAPVITTADGHGSVSETEVAGVPASTTPVMLDIETNDAFATAQLIDRADLRVADNANLADDADPSIEIQGNIATRDDQDVYRIDLRAGETLTLDIDFAGLIPGGGGLDSFVFLYDAAGNLMNFNDDSSTAAGGGGSTYTQDSFLQFVAGLDGTFYIVVKDFDQFGQSSAGTYSLNVSVDSQNLQLTDTGSMTFSDVDLADGHTVGVTAQDAGYLGALTAVIADDSTNDGTGSVNWTFSVANAAVQFLGAGETRIQTYTVTVDDGQGGTASETVTVTITGENDGPVISTAFSAGQITENGVPSIDGVIAFDDVDLIDSHTVSAEAATAGYLGTFTAVISDSATGEGAGEVTWTFSATDAELAYLAEGQSLLQRYIVTLDDGNGGTTQQLVNITIVGTNDAPTITSAVATGHVVEDANLSASGAIAFSDVDLRDAHAVSSAANADGYLGTFSAVLADDSTDDGEGSVSWSFTVDNAAIQHLAAGEILTQSYTVTVDDGNGGTVDQTVTVTLTGTNDAPVVQGVAANATEDGAPVTVAFSADDVDSDDDAGTLTYAITSAPAEGSVVNNGDGTFSFDPGADFQDLAEGETREITFGYDATDAHGATTAGSVTITVTGTNDAPVTGDVELGGTSVGVGFPLVFGGYYNYAAYNQDSGEVVFSLIDTNGDGIVDAPGSSSELADNAQTYDVNYGLAVGDVDGDGDVDVVVATNQGLVSYTNVGDTNGDGEANFVRSVLTNGFAGYDVALGDLDGDGRLDLVASRYNTLTELLNTGDANGDGLVNDFAARTVATGGQGNAYGISTADMNGDGLTDVIVANYVQGPNQILLNQGDTDGDGQLNYRVQNLNGVYNIYGMGATTGDIDGDGDLDLLISRWSNQNEVVYINDGDTNGDGLIDFRTIELPTGGYTMESELIDIDGDGDLDVVTSDLGGTARIAYNQGDPNGDGLVEFSIQTVTGASGNYGVAVGDVDGDGDLDIVFPSLNTNGAVYLQNQGDTDGDGQLNFARVSLTGVERSWDAEFTPNGGGGGGSGAYEDGPVVTGAFVGDDVDSDDDGATLTYTITSAPSEGSVVNNGDGTFGFSPGDDFQDLAQGETRTVTFTYTATDAHGAVSEPSTVTIRVAGTNDAPVAAVDTASGAEDASVTINVLANDTDVDGETLTITHVNGANIGVDGTVALGGGASVRLNADGALTYTPAANATGLQSFSYTVSDGVGGATTATVEVDLTPVNDAPVSQPDAASTDEDTTLVLTATSLLANDTDLDGDALVISSVSAVSARGASVSINAAGDVVYNPGVSAELQALSRSQQVTDTFTYVVTDAAGATSTATVTITVEGQLEAPVANPDTVTVSQNGQASGDVVANDIVTGSTDNSGNVLVNGSFEDGHSVGPGGLDYPASLPGWTSVQGSFEVWGTGFLGNTASDGTAFLELDNGGGQDAYSSNLTTDVGREYTLAFDLALRNGTSAISNRVEFFVNGVSLGVFTPPSTTFTTFTVSFIGSGSDVITFREPANANDGVGGLIDNLRIAADADVFVTAVDGDAALVGAEVEGSNGGEFILQSDGSYTFDTDGDFAHLGVGETATTSVTYTVTDDGGSASTTLTVTVEGENDGPVAADDAVAAVEDQPITFDVRSNDSDVDGDTLTVTHINGQAISAGGSVALGGGVLSLNPNGSLTYTPAANASGEVDFTYTVADGFGGVATASTTINVAGVADAPVLAVGSSTVLNPTVGSAIQTTVTLAAGDTVSFNWDFVAHDYMPFNDFAFASVNGAAYMLGSVQVVGDYGTTGWKTFTFTATEAGEYSFGVGVSNVNDSSLNSHLLVDNLQVNGVTISSFETGFTGWTTLGSVGVQGAHDGVTPTHGGQMAYLDSASFSAAAIESFLGLVPGRLARIAEAAGQQGDEVTVPISMTLGAGEATEDSYVVITGFPEGSTFNFGALDASGGWRVPASDLGGNLLINTPDDYSGSFTLSVVGATYIDESGSLASTAAQTITVTIDPAPSAVVAEAAPLVMSSKPAPEVSPQSDDDAFVMPPVDDTEPMVLPGLSGTELQLSDPADGPTVGDTSLTLSGDGSFTYGDDLFVLPAIADLEPLVLPDVSGTEFLLTELALPAGRMSGDMFLNLSTDGALSYSGDPASRPLGDLDLWS
ncbi:MAG: Ig-like domain-containing protein [Brevundimonas sp.]|uniref:Ig-like domain-containing protein n=1 Tax=Brevundimonas sp. TaxID=1871086 RepID=UPI002603E0FC|nr:tandem-95 repeat protein [Brevundimonas sp.]MDI6623291.1 Ig-like domain-containing protein [Brevundimonas sp.]MDQ7811608.1 Ig-like domain-containing protein [Brevundimonas sp.]